MKIKKHKTKKKTKKKRIKNKTNELGVFSDFLRGFCVCLCFCVLIDFIGQWGVFEGPPGHRR